MELMHWIIAIMSIALACIELIVIAYLFLVAWLARQETKHPVPGQSSPVRCVSWPVLVEYGRAF